MGKYSISFVVLVLIFGLFIGSVVGSLISQIFGLDILDRSLFGGSLKIAEDFYILKKLELRLTPAALIGAVVTGWVLYKKGKS